MKVCIPVTPDGTVDPRFGRAPRVAVATITDDVLSDWQEFDVLWDVTHDGGTEGAHHARVARFLKDHEITVVAARKMGVGMQRMLGSMHIRVAHDCTGDARRAAQSVVSAPTLGDLDEHR